MPGIVPVVKARVMSMPLPAPVKSFLDHPAGPFTIHFWAPTFKWAISIANLMDINRPVDKMSVAQQTAVAATGVIWCRYSMVIIPVNWNLFSVNLAMGSSGSYQLYRIIKWKYFGGEAADGAKAKEEAEGGK
ncbi:unnamed protein product [Vitrella brassicaformis CCMP3155]|uniref:Mitochondrial pyruvate carrier n=1 Tax=Vitrella brassicaformis (strain CCMP3155) TaxID=1169540 RepID=A0A0G4EIK8_VITBC|nr:unnamed protein product [Vitrella brassicaformis CCMP3155]|eukprot:CEL96589.1 unnamed protein product [Vitrella brassicaformis CCMP3155]